MQQTTSSDLDYSKLRASLQIIVQSLFLASSLKHNFKIWHANEVATPQQVSTGMSHKCSNNVGTTCIACKAPPQHPTAKIGYSLTAQFQVMDIMNQFPPHHYKCQQGTLQTSNLAGYCTPVSAGVAKRTRRLTAYSTSETWPNWVYS